MSIINIRKPRTDRSGWKTFGVSLPRRLGAYLSLYALTRNKTKSEVLRHQMEQWHQDHYKLCSETDLLHELVEKIRSLWHNYQSIHPGVEYDEFKTQLVNDLQHKGIEQSHIQTILQRLDETH